MHGMHQELNKLRNVTVTVVEPGSKRATSQPRNSCHTFCAPQSMSHYHTSSHMEPLRESSWSRRGRGGAATSALAKGPLCTHRHRWLCSAELPHPVSSGPSHRPSFFLEMPPDASEAPSHKRMCQKCAISAGKPSCLSL